MSSLSFSGTKTPGADAGKVALALDTPTIEARAVIKTTEEIVREFFMATPILVEIARCESRFKQRGRDGAVLRGAVNSKDIGIMQINEIYHGDRARKLGHDIYTLEGNLAYAKWLYEKEGRTPWSASSLCWGRAPLSMGT